MRSEKCALSCVNEWKESSGSVKISFLSGKHVLVQTIGEDTE